MARGEGPPPFARKAEQLFAPDLSAIALCDGGWSQKAYQINSPQWEYSVCFTFFVFCGDKRKNDQA